MGASWKHAKGKITAGIAVFLLAGSTWAQVPLSPMDPRPQCPAPGPFGSMAPGSPYGPYAANPSLPPLFPGAPAQAGMGGGPPPGAAGPTGAVSDAAGPDGKPPELCNDFFSAFDDRIDGCCLNEVCVPNLVAVDFLILRPTYAGGDPALQASINGGGPATRNFHEHDKMAPRIVLQWAPVDNFGIRGSWYRIGFGDDISFVNPGNTVITSIPVLGNLVTSPQTFGYLAALPPSLATAPPNAGNNFNRFPFTNAYNVGPSGGGGGSPDTMFFQNSLQVQVADLDFFAAFNTGRLVGNGSLGLRYADISHSYAAYRTNPGATNPAVVNVQVANRTIGGLIAGYAPLGADSTFFTDTTDFLNLYASSTFKGFGPTTGFHLEFPSDTYVRLYFDVKGTAILGNRTERVFVNGNQTGTFTTAGGLSESFQSSTSVSTSHTTFTCIPTVELEAGVSFTTEMRGFRPLIKIGGIAQYWGNAGNSTDVNGNLFLYGVNASIGFAF